MHRYEDMLDQQRSQEKVSSNILLNHHSNQMQQQQQQSTCWKVQIFLIYLFFWLMVVDDVDGNNARI
jgi:hypothetical protein